jgi:hypothetical protein
LVTSYSDVVSFLKSSETDPVIRLVLITIWVETEYRSVVRYLSGWGPNGEHNAPITAESKIIDLMRQLRLIQRSDSSMIAIGAVPEFRSVTRSLSRWGPNGEPNVPIVTESEVVDSLKLIWRLDSSMIAIGLWLEYR